MSENIEQQANALKNCIECKIDLPLYKFNTRKENTKHNGELRSKCIDCEKVYQQQYRLERSERKQRAIEKQKYETESGMRVCFKCEMPKLLNSDNFLIHHQDGNFQNTCRVCSSAICSKNYRIRQEEISKLPIEEQEVIINEKYLKDKEYRENNKEKEQKRHKEYNSREEVKEMRRNRENARRDADPTFKLKKDVSVSIRNGIKRSKGNKNGELTWVYLPYTPEVLRKHLEDQFEDWMSWDNWGVHDSNIYDPNDKSTWKWNIDHIIPHSNLSYSSLKDDNFQKAWALSNLRPYEARKNIVDGSTRARHNNQNSNE